MAIQGVGHVGAYLADKLAAAGARLTITDVDQAALRAVAARTGAAIVAPEALFDTPIDVFAPCALGGAINDRSLARLTARIVAGGANNQLATTAAGEALFARGVVYAPDFVINGGGIISIAGEICALAEGGAYDAAWVEAKLARLTGTLQTVLDRSLRERRPTQDIAIEIARERIAASQARPGTPPPRSRSCA